MSEARFSFNTRIGGDQLTVRGDSIDEFTVNMEEATTAVAAITGLQEALRAVAVVTTAVPQATVVETQAAPAAAPSGGIETMTDRNGAQWTYGLPDAADLPDGRGKYALKEGVAKSSGRPYKMWCDPAGGPKPFPKGQKIDPIWINSK